MDTRTEEFKIQGMSCGHCVEAVKRALNDVEGIEQQEVTIGAARVAYDPGITTRETISAAIEEAGYSVESVA